VFASLAEAGTQVGTAFIYQGQLKENDAPANGLYDFRFDLLAELSGARLARICVLRVDVVNGLFTADVDFGPAAFDGQALTLQVAVGRQTTDCSSNTFPDQYTPLGPPQRLTPAPYALHALSSANGHALDARDGDPRDAVFVDNDGNVGIGTVRPAGSLHVRPESIGATAIANSTLILERSGSNYLTILSTDAKERGVIFGEPDDGAAGGIVFDGEGTPDGLQFRTGGQRTRMVLDAIGRVGIGTTAPASRLHVGGEAGLDGVRFPDGTVQTTAYRRLKVAVVFNPPSVAAGASTTISIPVAGAAAGDVAIFTPRVGLPAGLIVAQTRVQTNEVAVTLFNASSVALDAASNTADVVVLK
jgi:hypothetical protein